jgi:hypothetical protein
MLPFILQLVIMAYVTILLLVGQLVIFQAGKEMGRSPNFPDAPPLFLTMLGVHLMLPVLMGISLMLLFAFAGA